jgi:hypothetical protein
MLTMLSIVDNMINRSQNYETVMEVSATRGTTALVY